MLRVDASNLPSVPGALRSRQLLPRPPAPPAVARHEPTRWSVRLELGDDEIAKLYGQGMTRGAVVWRKGMVEWRPLLITPELGELLRRTRTTLSSAPSLPGVEAPPPALALPPPPRMPSVLPPELADRPVTPTTVAPTAMDVAPAVKSRRPVEFAAVALAAFAFAWVGRGKLPGAGTAATPPLAMLEGPPASAAKPVACEPAVLATIATQSTIPTIAVTDLPLAGAEGPHGHVGAPDARRGRTRSIAESGSGPARADLVAALGRVAQAASGCGERGGPVRVVISFGSTGVARSIQVSGTELPASTRSCIISAASRARVPAFAGDPVTVSKTL